MIIAINTRDREGNEQFIFECFSRLAIKYPQHQFIFIFDKPPEEKWISSANTKAVSAGPCARSSLLWPFWYNYKVPAILRKYKADVFVSADGICSLRTKLPQCLLLRDIAFLHPLPAGKKNDHRFYKKFTPLFLARAKTIATVSAYSKKVIADRYKTDPGKINMICPGINGIYIPVEKEKNDIVKTKYAEGKEYFLFTGDIVPRNNLITLLKAFSFFKKRQKSNMQLLIAATAEIKDEKFITALKTFKFRNEVKLLTRLSLPELASVTAAAYAFVYPVLFGNFAEHPLEAMQCEVPVITSNCCAFPEICGNAALYFNPEDHVDIAEKMMQVFKDEQKCNELINTARSQVKQYHWNKTSDQFWQLIRNAIPEETT